MQIKLTISKTGIRDPDNIASVESSLLRPLRSFLEKWSNTEGMRVPYFSSCSLTGPSAANPILSVISLQIGLERVDYAVQIIRSR
ncbi:hypothetical protein EDB19DRAFT_1222566 [Suillus lakei]|nr:hypothetical protein EDB19DRAFT_1222566 [Suillus lakei]